MTSANEIPQNYLTHSRILQIAFIFKGVCWNIEGTKI